MVIKEIESIMFDMGTASIWFYGDMVNDDDGGSLALSSDATDEAVDLYITKLFEQLDLAFYYKQDKTLAMFLCDWQLEYLDDYLKRNPKSNVTEAIGAFFDDFEVGDK